MVLSFLTRSIDEEHWRHLIYEIPEDFYLLQLLDERMGEFIVRLESSSRSKRLC